MAKYATLTSPTPTHSLGQNPEKKLIISFLLVLKITMVMVHNVNDMYLINITDKFPPWRVFVMVGICRQAAIIIIGIIIPIFTIASFTSLIIIIIPNERLSSAVVVKFATTYLPSCPATSKIILSTFLEV